MHHVQHVCLHVSIRSYRSAKLQNTIERMAGRKQDVPSIVKYTTKRTITHIAPDNGEMFLGIIRGIRCDGHIALVRNGIILLRQNYPVDRIL